MGRKRDLGQVDAVAKEAGMTPEERRAFGAYIEECKGSGDYGSGPGGDFTMEELREKAREFLGE